MYLERQSSLILINSFPFNYITFLQTFPLPALPAGCTSLCGRECICAFQRDSWMHRDFGPTQIEAALSHSPHKTHWKSKMYMAGLGTQSWKTDTLELRLLWGSWFPSLCAGHPGSAAITPECPSFHHCSKTWSHYSVDVKFCTRKLLLWSLGVFWLLLQEAVLYLCLSYVTGPGSRLVNIYATSNELFPITYSHKLYQQLTFFFFFLRFYPKMETKNLCAVSDRKSFMCHSSSAADEWNLLCQ